MCKNTPVLKDEMHEVVPHRRLSFHAIPTHTQGGVLPVLGCRFQLSSEEAGGVK